MKGVLRCSGYLLPYFSQNTTSTVHADYKMGSSLFLLLFEIIIAFPLLFPPPKPTHYLSFFSFKIHALFFH